MKIRKLKDVVTSNRDQKLYVINHGSFVSCLGFEVLYKRLTSLSKEFDTPVKSKRKGSLKMYNEYQSLVRIAKKKFQDTKGNWQSQTGLIPEFIGREGQRVEVRTKSGERYRFIIGKSTGWIPCHIERKRSDSNGGMACLQDWYESIIFLRE